MIRDVICKESSSKTNLITMIYDVTAYGFEEHGGFYAQKLMYFLVINDD
jgi:hypothetical protein